MKKLNLIFALILFAFFISYSSYSILTKPTDLSIVETPETPQAVYSVADAEGPVIGPPSLDDPTPDSDEDVEVTAAISDIDGVQNATLFWQYTSLNTTLFN
ncbi:MAG: hypothetical protein JSW11_10300, partial [Candidatus Heimdallarchaeota archaeon]